MRGSYQFVNGTFEPRGEMTAIMERVARMSLLTDTGEGTPSFYIDETDGSYWQYRQFEDLRTELRRVDRTYIESNYPTVDPHRPV